MPSPSPSTFVIEKAPGPNSLSSPGPTVPRRCCEPKLAPPLFDTKPYVVLLAAQHRVVSSTTSSWSVRTVCGPGKSYGPPPVGANVCECEHAVLPRGTEQ